jgi:HflK protein
VGVLTDYLVAVFSMIAESAPWLFLGFLIAGILRVFIPQKKVTRYLGGESFRSVFLASILGVPLPLCSCSVLPTATALRKSGAGKGATTSFLISTPETGVDSIGITYALLDPLFTLIRPLAALFTALVTGGLVNKMVEAGYDKDEAPVEEECDADRCEATPNGVEAKGFRPGMREAWRYAFGPLLDDLTPWFILGFLLSGVLAIVIPEGFFGETVPNGWLAGILMAVIATPMYICAAGATPLAAVLIAKGLDPGAALVFLLVGPATNIATCLVVHRLLGRRVLIIYLVGVVGCALLLGAIVSDVYAGSGMDLPAAAKGAIEGGLSLFAILLGALLAALLIRSGFRTGLFSRWGGRLAKITRPIGFDPTSRSGRIVIVVLLLFVWLATSFSTVGPGETGWVVRFGRIVRDVPAPGLVIHWPAPIESVTTVPVDEVRIVRIGHVPRDGPKLVELEDEAEVMTGEENLLSAAYTVHFRVGDAFRFRYRVAEPATLVSALAQSALRETTARRDTATVLVGHRAELEREILDRLQRVLDEVDAGIRVETFVLEDVHATEDVHGAYRDVASALEDKQRSMREAEGEIAEALAIGRARAFHELEQAEGEYEERVRRARGEAEAFIERWKAWKEYPEVESLRMRFEAMEKALRPARLVLLLGDDVDVDLWSVGGVDAPPLPRMGAESEEDR